MRPSTPVLRKWAEPWCWSPTDRTATSCGRGAGGREPSCAQLSSSGAPRPALTSSVCVGGGGDGAQTAEEIGRVSSFCRKEWGLWRVERGKEEKEELPGL